MSSGMAIPFIEIKTIVENNQQVSNFELNPQAISFLNSLKDKYVYL